MGGHTILPVPKSVNLEANLYNRHWRRNMWLYIPAMVLLGVQLKRYNQMCVTQTKKFGEYFDWAHPDSPKVHKY